MDSIGQWGLCRFVYVELVPGVFVVVHVWQSRQEGACTLRFNKFLNAGRRLKQVKMDFVLPVTTRRLGTVGLALSVGIVKDSVSSLPVSTVLTPDGSVCRCIALGSSPK